MNKHAAGATPRREEILRLVRETPVHSQEELLVHLRQRGFKVTQPTLSRDLKELGLAKTPAGYLAPEDLSALSAAGLAFSPTEAREERLRLTVREFVVSVEQAGPLVVLRTPPAAAQPVARAIDAAQPPGAVGTIAGDDTVFVAARHEAAARRLVALLRSHLAAAPVPGRRRA